MRTFDRPKSGCPPCRENGFAVSARYDRRTSRIVVSLNTGVEVRFPPRLAEALAGAAPADLAEIETGVLRGSVSHWPKLDADVYMPALLQAFPRLQALDRC